MPDPTWLPEVIRAEGVICDIYPGAYERGHGDFGQIWGPFMHHTGSFSETPRGIAQHPSLGLASQIHLAASGAATLCGVGVAWHAGVGSWKGIPTNNGNQVCIGIEAAHNGTATWSDAQYGSYLRIVRAINKKLGNPWNKVVAHKEYGAIQGKWDPGNLDMKLFRARLLQAPGARPLVANMIEMEAKENPWVGVRHAKPGADGETVIGRDGRGRMVAYDTAHIYFHPSTGAFAIPHANADTSGLFEPFAQRGFERGPLGYPVRDFTLISTESHRGAVQAFQGGILYRRNGFPATLVGGVIGQRWAREGYEQGPLGWPTSDEQNNGAGGKIQMFEHGTLEWDPSGAVQRIGAAAARDLSLVNAQGFPLAVDAVTLVTA